MTSVYVIGTSCTRFGKLPDKSFNVTPRAKPTRGCSPTQAWTTASSALR